MADVPEDVQRWTAKRRLVLVLSIVKGETSVAEAARKFWVGTRPSEAIGLRRGRLDVKQGRVSIVISLTEGEDNPPKTARSRRTITLLAGVGRMLHEMPRPAVPKPDDFVFTTPEGHAVDGDRFVEQHWHRALSATGIRPRGFYSTRDTFISRALERGAKIKWVADYCGTSVEMIEKHYAKWLQGDDEQLRSLAGEVESPTPASNRDGVPISRVKAGQNRDFSGSRPPA